MPGLSATPPCGPRGAMNAEGLFQAAQAAVKPITGLGNNDKLAVYAYFKQATQGPASGPRPGFFDRVGRAKYDAWVALGTLSSEDAEREYCALADRFAPGWRLAAAPAAPLAPAAAPEDAADFAAHGVSNSSADGMPGAWLGGKGKQPSSPGANAANAVKAARRQPGSQAARQQGSQAATDPAARCHRIFFRPRIGEGALARSSLGGFPKRRAGRRTNVPPALRPEDFGTATEEPSRSPSARTLEGDAGSPSGQPAGWDQKIFLVCGFLVCGLTVT